MNTTNSMFQSSNKFTLPQICIMILLLTLLVTGLFHYSALSTSQRLMNSDLTEIRNQYVQLRMYISGQSNQDQEIQQIKADLLVIKKDLKIN